MHRTLPFSVDDLAADAKGVQETINNACSRRGQKYQLRGLAQIEDHVYFFLLPRPQSVTEEEYVLAPLEDIPTHEDMVGLISDRWTAGFDLIGSFNVYETTFLVFAHKPTKRKS